MSVWKVIISALFIYAIIFILSFVFSHVMEYVDERRLERAITPVDYRSPENRRRLILLLQHKKELVEACLKLTKPTLDETIKFEHYEDWDVYPNKDGFTIHGACSIYSSTRAWIKIYVFSLDKNFKNLKLVNVI